MKLKIRRHHADHRELDAIECYWLADDARLSTKTPLPQSVTEHGDWRFSHQLIVRQECSTENRIDSEHFEEICTSKLDGKFFRFTIASEVEALI